MASAVDPIAEAAACEELAPDLGWGLLTATRVFQRLANDAVADLPGGPRGYLVLMTVARGRPSSQLALARELGVDKTVMTYLLDELEAANLIERRPDPADRRARQVVITDQGQQTLLAFRERIAAAEQELLSALSSRDAHIFRDLVERIARASQAGTRHPCISEPAAEPC
jgi:DNA-binding MarR family transcriptional regulator